MPCMVSSMLAGLILLLLTDVCLGKSKGSHYFDKRRTPKRQNQVRGEISMPEESGEANEKNLDINVYLPRKIMKGYEDNNEKAGNTDHMTHNAQGFETSALPITSQQESKPAQSGGLMNSQALTLPSTSPLFHPLFQPVIQPLIDLAQANRAQSWTQSFPSNPPLPPASPSIIPPGTPPIAAPPPSFMPDPGNNQAAPATSLIFAPPAPPPPIVQVPAANPAQIFPFPVPLGQVQTGDTRSSTEPFTMSMINELSRALERQQMSGEMTSMSHAISETMLHALMLGRGLANDRPHDTVRDMHEIQEIHTDHRDHDYHDNSYHDHYYHDNDGDQDYQSPVHDYHFRGHYHEVPIHYDPLYDDIRHAVFAAHDDHADESERKIIHSLKNAFRDAVEEMKEKESLPDRSRKPKSNNDSNDDDNEDDSPKQKKKKHKRPTRKKTKSQDAPPGGQGIKPNPMQLVQSPPVVEQLAAPTESVQPLTQTVPAVVQAVPEPMQAIQTVQPVSQPVVPVAQPIAETVVTPQPQLALPMANAGTPTGSFVLEPAASPLVAQPQTIYQPLGAQQGLASPGGLVQAPVAAPPGNQLPVSESQPLALPASSPLGSIGNEGSVEENLSKGERRRRKRRRRKWNRLLQGEERDTRAYFHKQGNHHDLDSNSLLTNYREEDHDEEDDQGDLDSDTTFSNSKADTENYHNSISDKARQLGDRTKSMDSAKVVDIIPSEFFEAAEKPLKSAGVKLNELDANKKYEVLGKILAKAMAKAQERLKHKVKERHKDKRDPDNQDGGYRSNRQSTKPRHVASEDGDEDNDFDFMPVSPYFSMPS